MLLQLKYAKEFIERNFRSTFVWLFFKAQARKKLRIYSNLYKKIIEVVLIGLV